MLNKQFPRKNKTIKENIMTSKEQFKINLSNAEENYEELITRKNITEFMTAMKTLCLPQHIHRLSGDMI